MHLESKLCALYPTFSVSQWPAHAADKTLLQIRYGKMLRFLTGFPHSIICQTLAVQWIIYVRD